MTRSLIILLALLTSFESFGQTSYTGVVFHDVNNNGLLDSGEKGVAGVAVSDQVTVVASDTQGRYRIDSPKGNGFVMISVPDGYKVRDSFFAKTSGNPVDFALIKSDIKSEFSFLHASDTHVHEKNVDRMEKLKNVIASTKPDFVVITGDLVRDALRVPENIATNYYELFVKEKSKFSAPTLVVPGNHEIFGIERQLSLVNPNHPLYGRKMYHHYLGPDYYSFNYGGVHFVGLNSLSFEDLYYYGRIDSLQLLWLKNDIAAVPATTPIVTFQHVPFFSAGITLSGYEDFGPGRTLERVDGQLQFRHVVSNAQEVMTVLLPRNYPLALAGHFHARQRFVLEGVPTRFEQTGAVTGPATEGVLNSPSGVTLYKVKNGKIDEGKFIPLD